ncbi:MAG TPA: hypothetical protein VKM72_25850 [Thermoanaerobaculia bacterium]|nr:hypothetical protein [Thermoanaerobaculia bacterium]
MDPNRPNAKSSTSTLGWLGCGCGLLVALALAGIVGMTWFGYRKGKEIERTFKDPATRTQATREILQWRELPEGYYPAGAVSIPMLMEMAILSDEEPQPGEAGHGRAFHERGLVFMSFNSWIGKEDELLRWLRGETKEAPKWIRRSDAKIDPDQVLKRGAVEVNGQDIVYVVARGDARTQMPEPRSHARDESLMTFFSFDCPGDNRARLGVWFSPDPVPATPNAEVDLTGTVGDPERIREFVGHFEPCK